MRAMTLFCFSKVAFAALASWYDAKAPQRTRNQVPLPGSSVGRTKVPSYFSAKASASSRVGNADSCRVYLALGFAGAGSAAAVGLGAAADGFGAAGARGLGAAGIVLDGVAPLLGPAPSAFGKVNSAGGAAGPATMGG